MPAFRTAAAAVFFLVFAANAPAQDAIPIIDLIAKRSIELQEPRIALIKANLQIAEHQEEDWAKFETVLMDTLRERAFRKAALMVENDKRTRPLTPAELLNRQAEALRLRAHDMRVVAEAAEPLYRKLDREQRKHADELARIFAQRLFVDDDPRYRRRQSR